MDQKTSLHVTLNNHSTKKTPNVPVILSEKLEPVISNSEGKKSDNANAGKRLDFLSKPFQRL